MAGQKVTCQVVEMEELMEQIMAAQMGKQLETMVVGMAAETDR